jgi:nucleoside-diphosphate-sugar epimerase
MAAASDPNNPAQTGRTVAITGAGGSLGQALLRRLHRRGDRLIALTSGSTPLEIRDAQGCPIPLRQVGWAVGQEEELASLLAEVDLLVLNHGINVHGDRSVDSVERSLEVNALSLWRLLELFARVARLRPTRANNSSRPRPEVWVNTSEAEIQVAISPLYEISKRLLGQLLSLRAPVLERPDGATGFPGLRIRRLVLGPFRSNLNPVGVMGADFVANEIVRQAGWNCSLIIVTPNPFIYLLMPLTTLGRWLYVQALCRDAPPPQP